MSNSYNLNSFSLILISSILANSIAGLLYVWSLFIIPIESFIDLNRADLGLISSVALIGFTIGVSIFPFLLKKINRLFVSVLGFLLISFGHLCFGFFPFWITLLIGYGFGFGIGSGITYGLALYLTSSLDNKMRAISIGIALGAFALSGIMLPLMLGEWISKTLPNISFIWIGFVTFFIGMICVILISFIKLNISEKAASLSNDKIPLDISFLILSIIFFLICFSGLAVVSQSAAIASSAGIDTSGYATSIFTIGYLIGCLSGAPIAEKIKERYVLIGLSFFTFFGVLGMLSTSPAILFLGSALIGLTLGGVGSIMPVLLGQRYGPINISRLYGRMIIGYGLAGLISPVVAGLLFDFVSNYSLLLYLCVSITIISFLITFTLKAKKEKI